MRKALVILACIALIVSIFVPWITSWMFSVSPYQYFESFFKEYEAISKMQVDYRFYLPFLLIALPVCSLICIINEVRSQANRRTTLTCILIITLVMALVIAGWIYAAIKAESKNPLEGIAYGFWLALGGNVLLLITLLLETKQQPAISIPEPEAEIQETVTEQAE